MFSKRDATPSVLYRKAGENCVLQTPSWDVHLKVHWFRGIAVGEYLVYWGSIHVYTCAEVVLRTLGNSTGFKGLAVES